MLCIAHFFFLHACFWVLRAGKYSSTVEDPVDAVHTSIWNNKGVFRDLLVNNDSHRGASLPTLAESALESPYRGENSGIPVLPVHACTWEVVIWNQSQQELIAE